MLPRDCLPPMVPNFTGRQSECHEIVGLLASESTRIVSIWGSSGFGKRSVTITVGHDLQSQGLPVYWLSLRGLQSKGDFTSKLLSFIKRLAANKQPSAQYLSFDDELCQLFSEIANRCVLILDDADDLLESRFPEVKEEVIELLEEILLRSEKVTLAVTTRECLINSHFQGHQSVRIGPLDEASSQILVHGLLPNASTSDCTRIAQICGHVPLAIKLLCSSVSEENARLNQFLGDVFESSTEMMDNPDYSLNRQLHFLFDYCFQKLSLQEKEALVSLSILPENFGIEIAAAVLGKTRVVEGKKMLQSLRRKSFLDSSSTPESFSMHKFLQSFVRVIGEHQMKDILLDSRARFYAFYVSLFETLNEQFLTGHSMSAFIAFYEDKQSIVQSLIEGCSSSKTADGVFDVLVKAELFLDSLFWISNEADNFDKIYDSALKAANVLEKRVFYRRLLVSRAFSEVTWGAGGSAMQLLSEAREILAKSSPVASDEKGKYLCYSGICQLVAEETESGVQCLHEALSLMNNSAEQTILRLIIFQILAVYYQIKRNSASSSHFYSKAFQECRTENDTHAQLLVIPPIDSPTLKTDEKTSVPHRGTETLLDQPLELQVVFHVKEASKHFSHTNIDNSLRNFLLKILKEVETALPNDAPGLLNFHCTVGNMLPHFIGQFEDTEEMSEVSKGLNHPAALEHSKSSSNSSVSSSEMQKEVLAKSYLDLGEFQYSKGNLSEALQSFQSAVNITRKLFGEDHPSTAESYFSLGTTQHALGDFTSALWSKRHALSIRQRQPGDEAASSIADCLYSLGSTQLALGDFTSALQSTQCALKIRARLFGDEHPSTAEGYYALGITQHAVGDLTSSLRSTQRALEIRRKLFGEEHSSTADSYNSLGAVLHALGELASALQSKQRATEIRLQLFGEDHPSTAESYNSLGVTQHSQSDFISALASKQHALEIRLRLFGEEHWSTAESYYSLGGTQYKLGEYTLALQSKQRALTIRRKLFGEDHSSTAYSYYSLGATQHALGDFVSALQSKQRATDIRLKLFGEDNSSTANSFYSLGVTQHELGDFEAALQSLKRAIAIRLKLFGKELSSTTD